MSTSKGKILHFGLAGHPTDASISNETVQSLVKEGADEARAAGYEVQLTFVDPAVFLNHLLELRQRLVTEKWDALIIGGGLKNTPFLTPQFEHTINLARDSAPTMKILFQMAPGDIYDTIRRGLEFEGQV